MLIVFFRLLLQDDNEDFHHVQHPYAYWKDDLVRRKTPLEFFEFDIYNWEPSAPFTTIWQKKNKKKQTYLSDCLGCVHCLTTLTDLAS